MCALVLLSYCTCLHPVPLYVPAPPQQVQYLWLSVMPVLNVNTMVDAGFEKLTQVIMVLHLHNSVTHPIHLIWLILNLNHTMCHTWPLASKKKVRKKERKKEKRKKGELTLIEKTVMSVHCQSPKWYPEANQLATYVQYHQTQADIWIWQHIFIECA